MDHDSAVRAAAVPAPPTQQPASLGSTDASTVKPQPLSMAGDAPPRPLVTVTALPSAGGQNLNSAAQLAAQQPPQSLPPLQSPTTALPAPVAAAPLVQPLPTHVTMSSAASSLTQQPSPPTGVQQSQRAAAEQHAQAAPSTANDWTPKALTPALPAGGPLGGAADAQHQQPLAAAPPGGQIDLTAATGLPQQAQTPLPSLPTAVPPAPSAADSVAVRVLPSQELPKALPTMRHPTPPASTVTLPFGGVPPAAYTRPPFAGHRTFQQAPHAVSRPPPTRMGGGGGANSAGPGVLPSPLPPTVMDSTGGMKFPVGGGPPMPQAGRGGPGGVPPPAVSRLPPHAVSARPPMMGAPRAPVLNLPPLTGSTWHPSQGLPVPLPGPGRGGPQAMPMAANSHIGLPPPSRNLAVDFALAKERRRVVELLREQLPPSAHDLDPTTAEYLYEVLGCPAMTGKLIECRLKGVEPVLRGIVTADGLVRSSRSAPEVTLSQWEAQAMVQALPNAPTEELMVAEAVTFIRHLEITVAELCYLVSQVTGADFHVGYCLRCHDHHQGEHLRCIACPSTFHAQCLKVAPAFASDGSWMCPDCVNMRVRPGGDDYGISRMPAGVPGDFAARGGGRLGAHGGRGRTLGRGRGGPGGRGLAPPGMYQPPLYPPQYLVSPPPLQPQRRSLGADPGTGNGLDAGAAASGARRPRRGGEAAAVATLAVGRMSRTGSAGAGGRLGTSRRAARKGKSDMSDDDSDEDYTENDGGGQKRRRVSSDERDDDGQYNDQGHYSDGLDLLNAAAAFTAAGGGTHQGALSAAERADVVSQSLALATGLVNIVCSCGNLDQAKRHAATAGSDLIRLLGSLV